MRIFIKRELIVFPVHERRNTVLKRVVQEFVTFSWHCSCLRELGKQVTVTLKMFEHLNASGVPGKYSILLIYLRFAVRFFFSSVSLFSQFFIAGTLLWKFEAEIQEFATGGPPFTWKPLMLFWPMYAQVGDFCISRGPPTVPLTQICITWFIWSPKTRVMWGPSVSFSCLRELGKQITRTTYWNRILFSLFLFCFCFITDILFVTFRGAH